MPLVPWIAASAALLLALGAAATWRAARWRRPRPSAALPDAWTIASRPVFDSAERRVYQLLREALPHHVVLSKLPLARFCQPVDPTEHRRWHALLGGSHVGFAVCSPNGRVLAAIDLDGERSPSRRALLVKQAALRACRVRYLRCGVDRLPSLAELQLLVPHPPLATRSPQPASACPARVRAATRPLGGTARRTDRRVLWQDAALFDDAALGRDVVPTAPPRSAAGPDPSSAPPGPRPAPRARPIVPAPHGPQPARS